jgi:putative nucleotidyltransferase with HDIG domain
MQKELTIKEAEKLMKMCLKKHPHKITHSIKVSKFAYQIAKKIKKKNPDLNINLKEIRILGLLHDIGRGLHERWRFHTFEGAKFLRKSGYNRYASKIEKHDPSHELANHLNIKGNFLPTLIDEKILIYADAHYKDGKFVGPKEREKIAIKFLKDKKSDISYFRKDYQKRHNKIIKEIEKLIK